MNSQLIIETAVFAFALWLGLYLISRDLADRRLLFAGLGLAAYALALSLGLLADYAPTPVSGIRLSNWQRPFLLLPALFWLLLLITLLRDDVPWRIRLRQHKRPLAVILAATIFFGLGLSMLLLPFNWFPQYWIILGIGFDLVLLGVAIAVLDAFDEGEALLPHFSRSLVYTFFTILIFAGQVALVMAAGVGINFLMLSLLLTTITAAILVQTFNQPFQTGLDRLVWFSQPETREARTNLRVEADVLTRLDESLDLVTMEETEFNRLTRRALSHMGNLPKLASSPLTRLPIINNQLPDNGRRAHTLERAAALKTILTDSIGRLKPPGEIEFGTTDEWRHYNALYFPYVVGLRPYSRQSHPNTLDPTTRQAYEWFRVEVPQRTLYNWQNAAARLVAQDLRERA